MSNHILYLMGPTASGKTALACEWASRYPVEIISVDSALIYKGMDIGTAKPTPDVLAQYPHHLIDILSPDMTYSAAAFCRDAHLLCEDIIKRGKLPLLVGGTMMYFHAFQYGLSTLPSADEALREQIHAEAQIHGWPALHQKLTLLDAAAGARIHPHDAQRIQRALEIIYLGANQSQQRDAPSPFQISEFGLFPIERTALHQRIAERFELMLQQGFLDEVAYLMRTWDLPETAPAMRCVGYRQARAYLQGHIDYETFKSQSVAATRQLAKRQFTWLRRRTNTHFIENPESAQSFVAIIEKILDNGDYVL